MTAAGTRAWRWIAGSVATLAIGAALVVGALRVAIAYLPDIEARVAEQVRAQTGLALSFDSLDARLGWYGPEVYFEGARVAGAERGEVLVTADAGRVSLALLRSLLNWRPEIGRVVLESPRLDFVIFPDRHVEFAGQAGIELDPDRPCRKFSFERLPRGVVEIRDATLGFRDLGLEGADFELRHVDLELSRAAREIELEGSVDLPRRFGERLGFEAEASGDLAVPGSLEWRVRVDARDLDFAGLSASFPWARPLPTAGRGSARLEAAGEGRRVAGANGSLDFDGLALPGTAGPAATYSRVSADFSLVEDDGWRLFVRGLDLSMQGRPWEPGPVEMVLQSESGQSQRVELRARFLRLENLLPLVGLAPASGPRDELLGLAPRGVLRNVDLAASRFAGGTMPDLEGSLAFAGLGFAPRGRAPGVDGLSGRLEARGDRGSLAIAADGATVDWPVEWRESQRFPAVSAGAGWQRVPAGLRAWADDVVVETGHGTVGGRVRLLLRPGETPLMDVAARVSDFDVAQARRYLPITRLTPRAVEWLDDAFLAGRIVSGEVVVTGPARGFPYRDGQGLFRAAAHAEGLTLAYAPGWPAAEGLAVDVIFEGPGFRASNLRGTVAGIEVPAATAELADWRDSLLILRADLAGDAGAAQRLLASSPLAPRLGETFGRLQASGRLAGEAVMLLPLKQFAERVITVSASGRGLRLALPGLSEPVTSLQGRLTVRNTELYAPRLVGEALGGRFEARIDTRVDQGGALTTTLDASGTLDGGRLPALLKLPQTVSLSGTAAWRANWTIPRARAGRDDAGPSRIRIQSDLAGLASGLPAPLGKAAPARRPLRAEIEIAPDGALDVEAALDRELRARLLFLRGPQGRSLDRGIVRLGGGEPAGLPAAPGLRIDGRVAALSVSDLLKLRSPTPGARRLQDWLADVEVDAGRLEVLGYEFERVFGRMRPGPRGWDIELEAPAAAGRVLVPYDFAGETPLALDMEHLTVGPRVRRGEGEPDPRQLPSIRADVRAMQFDRYDLGHLTARLLRRGDGLALERFAIEHDAYTASGSGAWVAGAAGQQCSLDLDLASGDARGLLVALGFAPLVEAEEAGLEARLTWPGAPDDSVLARVSGQAKLRFAKGRIASVDPGAGRMLGLMSLAHLPRRLALDFHDVTEEGLAFDTVTGDFRLVAGTAYSDDLVLRGPATEIGIAGRTDLGKRTYDQTAIVTGQLGASLGVAGALAAGPAVGAALYLFSQIFKEPLSGAVRAYYRISGPWDSPTVRKIDADELKEAAGLAVAPGAARAPQAPGGAP